MKSREQLLVAMMHDFRTSWSLAISSKDVQVLQSRYAQNGYPFLASDLPRLDDALTEGLSSGLLHPVKGFKPLKSSPVPQFLSGLWLQIFDIDGVLRVNPCSRSIFAIRQISRAFKKVFEVCSEDKVSAAKQRFKDVDASLTDVDIDVDEYSRVFSKLFGRGVWGITHKEFSPRHGPGATAERDNSISRWDFKSIPERILNWFSIGDFIPQYRLHEFVQSHDLIGRVTAVPKTFDKPRLISIEPGAGQYAQQGVLRELERLLRAHPSTDLSDQSRNQSLAQRGSIDGSLATIDLSDASDRISIDLIEKLMSRSPRFLSLIMDLRTPTVSLDGSEITLRKFASMGSALTFPIQIMVFMTIVVVGIMRAVGGSAEEWIRSSDVGVYGDDIIVPSHCAASVISCLEECGLVVNKSKSFWTGLFRESCGGDFFAGNRVNPVYVRKQPPESRRDVDKLVSWSAMAWLLDGIGLHGAARFASDTVQSFLPGITSDGQGALTVPYAPPSRKRWNASLQLLEGRVLYAREHRLPAEASDDAVLAFALHNVKGSSTTPLSGGVAYDPYALSHHGRPASAFISSRWAPIF